jgi:hypothetical protein
VKRAEVSPDGQTAEIYLQEVTQAPVCVSFHAVRRYVVESLQPALSTVEAYYDPPMRAEVMMSVAQNAETRQLPPPGVRARVCLCRERAPGIVMGVRELWDGGEPGGSKTAVGWGANVCNASTPTSADDR